MRAIAAVLLLTVAVPAVAGDKEKRPDLAGVLRLVGRYNVGHACPIAADAAITCAHVVDGWREGRDVGTLPHVWGTAGGSEAGLTYPVAVARFRDLAKIAPQGAPFPRWYQVAAEAPQPGDRVAYLSYEWKSKKSAFAESRIDTRVVRTVSGHLVTEDGGPGGSSGSCLLNERDEVVAVNCMGFGVNRGNDVVGLSVGVWGSWLEAGTDEPGASK